MKSLLGQETSSLFWRFMRKGGLREGMGVLFVTFMLLSFGGCKKEGSSGPVVQNVPPQKTLRDFFVNRAEPRYFSYRTRLENRVLVLRFLEFPESPAELANMGFHVAYGYGERYEVREQRVLEVYPLVDAPLETPSTLRDSQESVSSSNQPEGALTEDLPSMESLVYEATPRFQWESSYRITAGPLVFADTILLWTARPSCVILDRISGRLVRESSLSYYVAGFDSFSEDHGELVLIHGDQSLGYYTLQEGLSEEEGPGTEKAFAEILGPTEEARRKIEQKVGSLLSRQGVSLPRTYLFPVRDDPDPLNPRLFRWDCPEGGSYLLSLEPPKGMNLFPCMVALFNGAGEFLSSNLEYEAASRFEFTRGEAGTLYFVVAFLDFPEGKPEGENSPGIGEKPISEPSSISTGAKEEIARGFRIILHKR